MIVILSVIAIVGGQSVFAGSSAQNSASGFRDGCSDAQSGSSAAFNGHSNASHHSADYITGYNQGLSSCSVQSTVAVSNQNSNNVDQNNRNQNQGQSITNPHQNCFTVIGNCSTTNALGQSLNN